MKLNCSFIIYLLLNCVIANSWKQEYDYIIRGGTAGSVLARRLSESPQVSVLVLEAGKNIFGNSLVSIPRTWRSVLRFPDYNYGYSTEPEPSANNRSITVLAAKMLGGSCSHNGLAIVRGSRHDFNHWEKLGNHGWAYRDVLPYFKKSEEVLNQELASNGFHGTSGPMKTNFAYRHPIQDVMLNAGIELGYKNTDDLNGAHQEFFGVAQLSVDRSGKRSSTAESHLRPVLGRANLDLVTEAFVTKIKLKRSKANRVQFDFGTMKKAFSVKAKKEVIVCAGAVNSPKILMLSGIGPQRHLESIGIKVQRNLPVGSTLHDHPILPSFVFTSNLTGTQLFAPHSLFEYMFQGKGIWSSSGVEVFGFFRSKTQLQSMKAPFIELILIFSSPSLPAKVASIIRNRATIPKELLTELINSGFRPNKFNIFPLLLHPRSSGTYMLRSKDPYDLPIIKINLMNNEKDIADMIEAIRLIQKFVATDAMKAVNVQLVSSPNTICDKDSLIFNSDEYWKCVIHNTVTNANHWSSSCPMGPSGVLTSELRVKGVKNLRVIDASVMPTTISGHTMAATIMIAEKGADLVKKSNNVFKIK